MWQAIGQSRAVSLLQRSLERGALAHAYLFVGLPHIGKMTLALNLAQALNCESAKPPCGECASCQKIARGMHADVQIIGLGADIGVFVRGDIRGRNGRDLSTDRKREAPIKDAPKQKEG